MSKASDNENMAGILQRHLKTLPVGKGFYPGEEDRWAGPATQSAFFESIGQARPVPPIVSQPPVDLSGLPKPAELYVLPRETPEAMTAFYGAPSKNPTNLEWFSFPCEGIRLYSRDGVLLGDKVIQDGSAGQDGLPDHRCHRLLVGRYEAALAEIYLTLGPAEFFRQGWHVYAGFHNYRQKTGGSGLSTHSWGGAVDNNPDENTYSMRTTTFSDVAIDIMEKWGFLSGFRAWGRDAMHFQAVIPNLSAGSYYARNGLPKNIRAAA